MPRKLTQKEAVKKAKAVHDGKYKIYGKYKGTRENWDIKCPVHGWFSQVADYHMSGNGCAKCYRDRQNQVKKKTQQQIESEFNNVHSGKYTYGKYKGDGKKMDIFCPNHGKFIQTPNHHLKGHGCPKCGIESRSKKKTLSESDVISRCIAVHGSRYTYGKYPGHVGKKWPIKCNKHGWFKQTPSKHYNGQGCPKCNETNGESYVSTILDKLGIIFESQKAINCGGKIAYRLDFYFELKGRKYAIEYDGPQHFQAMKIFGGMLGFESQKKRDKKKNDYCLKNNINLIRIDGRKNKTPEKIQKYIADRLL